MTTWTFHHFNGFLNYTSVFTSRVYCWDSFNLSFSFACGNRCVEGRNVKILMLLQEEKGHGCMYPNISVKSFRIHIWFTLKYTDRYKRSLHFTFRYIDDILSLNNSKRFDFVDCIYPTELEIKDTLCLFMH
jgi:hypothetical protein